VFHRKDRFFTDFHRRAIDSDVASLLSHHQFVNLCVHAITCLLPSACHPTTRLLIINL